MINQPVFIVSDEQRPSQPIVIFIKEGIRLNLSAIKNFILFHHVEGHNSYNERTTWNNHTNHFHSRSHIFIINSG